MRAAVALLACLPAAWVARAAPVMQVQPGVARPGDAVLITVRGAPAAPEGTIGDRPLRFLGGPARYEAVIGLPVEMAAGTLELSVQVPAGDGSSVEELTGELEVTAPRFNERELTVASKFIEPPARVKRWIAADRAAFSSAWKQPLVRRAFEKNFLWPHLAPVTAPYGDLRLFNGKKQSQHFGTDIDGKTGEPVLVANAGKVVMARECYASGNTVLVHHGAALFTAYFHLSRIDVRSGAKVKQGHRLGLVGKTGRVTGPHLHWGVKIDGLWIDAESLLRLNFE